MGNHRLGFGLLAVVFVVGCSSDSGEKHQAPNCGDERCGADQVCDVAAGRCRPRLPDRCTAGAPWSPGTAAFVESTAGRGLDGVTGVRIQAVDYDGDGHPDLFVRRAGLAADDFTPGGTRATWLLRNRGDGTFADVTRESGLVATRAGTDPTRGRPAEIAAWADVDNDGDLDVFTAINANDSANLPAETAELMWNDGDGTFSLGPADSELRRPDRTAPRTGASFVDVDRDGRVDLWVGNGAVSGKAPSADEFFHNDGDGRFTEVADEYGLGTKHWRALDDLDAALAHTNSWSVAAADLDGNGIPELLSASYGRAPNHLWLGEPGEDGGPPRFRNHSIASGYAFDHRVDWTDNESARCWCKLHRDDQDCAGVPEPELIRCESDADVFRWDHETDRRPFRLGGNSGTTVVGDVNGDGWLDLVTSEIVHWDVGSSSDPAELLVNAAEPVLRFERPGAEETGLRIEHDRIDWNDGVMTAAVFDFDLDGRPDVLLNSSDYPGTRAHLYHQRADGRFEEVPPAEGIDSMAAHGVGVADFDGDGDLDVLLGHSHARCDDQCYETAEVRYFENVSAPGNWVRLRLHGAAGDTGANRAAIGARVEVRTADRLQVQEVGGGHGHYGIQHDLALTFGLGTACEAEVTVRWPDAALSTQRFTVKAGYRYEVHQGQLPEP
jgi:hypothetical protein